MHDLLPAETQRRQHFEQLLRSIAGGHGYREIRTPILERTELFRRSIGDSTDIVEKEMYSFTDRNGDNLSLRPENTAAVARAVLENGELRGNRNRLWYLGPMFRRERPQRGRLRQFHQAGVEAIGIDGLLVEAEIIALATRLWRELGIDSKLRLEISTLGNSEERQAFRRTLVDWLEPRRNQLDEDSQRRMKTNPLRILDSKDPQTQQQLADAPTLWDHLQPASRERFMQLRSLLEAASIPYEVNPRLVRGLDYYDHSVFEWIAAGLGSQDAICAGGRYDRLFSQLSAQPIPAVGWALGIERVLEAAGDPEPEVPPQAYLVAAGEGTGPAAVGLASQLRDQCAGLTLIVDGVGSIKAQLRRADRSGALWALILGENEVRDASVLLKPLRDRAEQSKCGWGELGERLSEVVGRP